MVGLVVGHLKHLFKPTQFYDYVEIMDILHVSPPSASGTELKFSNLTLTDWLGMRVSAFLGQ